jgi:hypothetical protein
MMSHQEIGAISQQWIAAWNAHDVEAILALYADEVLYMSLKAEKAGYLGGVVRSKESLRAYYSRWLAQAPGLQFVPINTYAGVNSLVIQYMDESGRPAVQGLEFNACHKVIRAAALCGIDE